jgi:hypothetical protein
MMTHVKFNTHNLKGKQCEVTEFFYFQSGEALNDFNQQYSSADGKVDATGFSTPLYDNNICNDFTIFIPYSELHLPKGTINNLKFHVEVFNGDETLDTSVWVPFSVTQY